MSNLVNVPQPTLPEVDVPIPTVTPRRALTKALKTYFASLLFQRPGGGERFRVTAKNVLEEWPDPEHKMTYPSISIAPGTGEYGMLSLTPSVEEDTYEVYSPSTALVQLAEYTETFQVTVWGADSGERRALVAGLESAMVPSDATYGVWLRTEDYFDRIGSYQLMRVEWIDGEETARNVRRADLYIDARIPVVKLMAFRPMEPKVDVEVVEVVSAEVLVEDGAVIVATCNPLKEI
jgi:hypothetical protein